MKINKYVKKKIDIFSEEKAKQVSDEYDFCDYLKVKEAFINTVILCLKNDLIRKKDKLYIKKITDHYCKNIYKAIPSMITKNDKYDYLLVLRLYIISIMRDTYSSKNHNFFSSISCFCKSIRNRFAKYL